MKRYNFYPGGFGQCDSGCEASMFPEPDGEYFRVDDVVELVEGLRAGIIEHAPANPSETEQGVLTGGMTAVRLILCSLNSAPEGGSDGA